MKLELPSRRRFPIRRVAVIILAACGLGSVVAAQSVTVQFVNGKNGKPVGNGKRIYVAFQNGPIRTILNLHTDNEGAVQFDVEGAKTFRVAPIGYVTCGEQAVDAPLKDYSVDDVVNDGLVTRNNCGTFDSQPQPGRMLYFVKKESPSESFKNLN
jgi:hypothetical protein